MEVEVELAPPFDTPPSALNDGGPRRRPLRESGTVRVWLSGPFMGVWIVLCSPLRGHRSPGSSGGRATVNDGSSVVDLRTLPAGPRHWIVGPTHLQSGACLT